MRLLISSRHSLKLSLLLTLGLLMTCASSFAQQPGPNVNVLPSYGSPNATDPLRGDGYLQRQVEPAIAASSRNPDHLLAAFIDFRAVGIAGGAAPPAYTASQEAWIGLSRSYDRGRTWFGSMVPGFPGDMSPVGMSSPLYGLSAGGDPGLAPATNGIFYLSGLFFNRDGISNIAVVKYQDIPDKDGGDNIRYQQAWIVDKGSMSAQGNFNDKPAIVADIARDTKSGSPAADKCGGVYVAYSIFNGGTTGVGFKSKLGFSRSKEGKCGNGWEKPLYLNKFWPQNQGAAIAVNGRNGKIYVVWRHFATPPGVIPSYPDAILMATSDNFGGTFTDPVVIAKAPEFRPFDQPPIATQTYTAVDPPAFRTNAYPTIAVDGMGRVYVAIQEKRGGPDGKSPRIVLRTIQGTPGQTAGVVVEDPGSQSNAHQVLPVLSFGGGQLRLMWYDFRYQMQGLDVIGESYGLTNGFISGLDRKMNVRLAQAATDTSGTITFSPSVLVSQYFIDVNSGMIPKISTDYPAINRPNLPMYSSGHIAFASDYIGLLAAAQFVRPVSGDQEFGKLPWRWAYKSSDYAARSSYGVWYDTRDVVFPSSPYSGIAGSWDFYDPPGTGKQCKNPGSRDGNVYFSEIKPGIVVGSPALSRQLDTLDNKGNPIQRAFPFYVENPNSDKKFFRINLESPNLIGSFVQFGNPVTAFDVEILPYSTTTNSAYVTCPIPCSNPFSPFTINVNEIDKIGGSELPTPLKGSITFNAESTHPTVIDPIIGGNLGNEKHTAQVSNPQYSNPQYSNPQYSNPQYSNPQYSNPQYSNPQYSNPQYSNYAPVGDFTWTVTNLGNNASAYTSLTNIATPPPGYTYQLILSRTYYTPTFNGCSTVQKPQDQVISIIPFDPSNPQYSNPQYSNPQYSNPQYSNATFSLTPASAAPSGSQALSTLAQAALAPSTSLPEDATTKMPRAPEEVKITLRVLAPWPGQSGSAPPPLCTDNPEACTNDPDVKVFLDQTSQIVYPQSANTGETQPTPASNKPFLVFSTQPSDTIVNTWITPAVRVEARGANGQLMSSVPITLAIGGIPTEAQLSGTLTQVTGPDGIAVFSDLSIDTTGSGYTLVASSAGYTNAVSNVFNIVAPQAQGMVTDLLGDATSWTGLISPDLISASAITVAPGVVKYSVRFAPGTFNPQTTFAEFVLDTDQNILTGSPGVDGGCANDATLMGTDYLIWMGSACLGGMARIWQATEGGGCNAYTPIGSIPVTLVPDGMDVTVPQSLLKYPTSVNFKVTTSAEISTCGYTTVLDYMPNVGLPPGTISFITALPPDGVVGLDYSYTLTATPGSGSPTWSLVSGALPTGLNLSTAGVISGTPTATGIFDFSVEAVNPDSQKPIGSVRLSIRVIQALFNNFRTATIDGVMNPGEWDGAAKLDFAANRLPSEGGGTTPATLYVMNDGSNLYLGVKVARSTLGYGSLDFEFDNNNDGVQQIGEEILLVNQEIVGFLFDEVLTSAGGVLDTDVGGTNDGQGAVTNNGTFSFYEISHPLKSPDVLHDFGLSPGDTVGFYSMLRFCDTTECADTYVPIPIFSFIHMTIATPP